MTERQLFLAIGEVDATMVAAATPFERRRPVYGWVLAAAAAVVIGVVGYAGLMEWRGQQPPVIDPIPSTTTTTATQTPTQPDHLPLLTDDGRLTSTSEGAGMVPEVTAFTFEELQIQSITEAPSVLPVYSVDFEKFDEQEELEAIIERYVALVEDTLTVPIAASEYGGIVSAEGEKFRYRVMPPDESLGTYNSIALWLQQPIAMGETDEWLARVLAHCPGLFAEMEQPALRLCNGIRERLREGAGWRADDTVTFSAYVYDAAIEDEAANWLNSVSVYVHEGELWGYTVYLDEHYTKVGDYPILSVDEAKATVRQMYEGTEGKWINENFEIVSVELQYIVGSIGRLRVPFYRFLLAADETKDGKWIHETTGMTMFYEKYICAVPAEFWVTATEDLLTTQK